MNWEETTTSQKKKSGWSVKTFSKQQWLVLMLLGLLLAVMALPTGEKSKGAAASSALMKERDGKMETIASDLEQKLAGLLGRMEGVGQVEVMLYRHEGGGDFASVNLTKETRGEIRGALIVAEGADNPVTIRNIQEAVMALFQVEAHKIKVVKMK